MSISREAAWRHLCNWTKTESLLKHARAVEIVMGQAALQYGSVLEEEEKWRVTGLLHDADYEQWPEDHPKRTVAWLREHGEEEIAHAVSAHYTKWNVPYENMLDKCILACDELTGFVIAACRVRPDGIATLTAQSVKKKLKDKAFAAKVDRHEIAAGAELLGVDLMQHIQFVIDALKPCAEEFGIKNN
jgi:predicted hydrolase (HD superfamily)